MANLNLNKITKKNWYLILAFVILFLLSMSYNLIFYPLLQEVKSLVALKEQKENGIQKAEIDPQYLEKLEAQNKELQSQMEYYRGNLQALSDVPQILKGLNQIAERLNVKFVSVNPAERKKIELPGGKDYLIQVPIKLSLKCGYHELGIFINRIENSSQFMKVTDLKLNSDSQEIWTHQAELVITSYGWGQEERPEIE